MARITRATRPLQFLTMHKAYYALATLFTILLLIHLGMPVEKEVLSPDIVNKERAPSTGTSNSEDISDTFTEKDASRSSSISKEVDNSKKVRDFFSIAKGYHTDKVQGPEHMKACLEDPTKCNPSSATAKNKRCRTFHSHFYHTMYQKWLGDKYSTDDAAPFQFLEIGFFRGGGYQSYVEFMPKGEGHSIEINCDKKKPLFKNLMDQNRLHCGSASNIKFLTKTWNNKMNRMDAPPLKLVIDDGSHQAEHMADTLFFWFPKIAPGGLLIVEDIEPIRTANKFRTEFLPQIMRDLHYCGHSDEVNKNFIPDDPQCFPTLQPLLASIHCEMHICVFERNEEPARLDLTEEQLTKPSHALDARKCFGR